VNAFYRSNYSDRAELVRCARFRSLAVRSNAARTGTQEETVIDEALVEISLLFVVEHQKAGVLLIAQRGDSRIPDDITKTMQQGEPLGTGCLPLLSAALMTVWTRS
jgi:hypothetical protein